MQPRGAAPAPSTIIGGGDGANGAGGRRVVALSAGGALGTGADVSDRFPVPGFKLGLVL